MAAQLLVLHFANEVGRLVTKTLSDMAGFILNQRVKRSALFLHIASFCTKVKLARVKSMTFKSFKNIGPQNGNPSFKSWGKEEPLRD